MKGRKKNICTIIMILFTFLLSIGREFPERQVFASNRKIKIRYDKERVENLFVGDSYQLKVVGTKAKVKWKSSNKSVAKVDKKGKVIGKKPGKVIITAKVKNVVFAVDFIILKRPEEVEKTEKEEEMIEKIKELRKIYKQGMSWGDEKSYVCEALLTEGRGCAALAFEMSDLLFGKDVPFVQIDDFTNIEEEIRIGDIIRVDEDSHSVVVIDRDTEGVTIVEGNFTLYEQKSIIHWGERMSYQKLREIGSYYHTRYPR